ncbi:hypothetical protein CY35_12G000500 [Sphagnum magellanicum]|nr:hypothetical protein CY35_12G000500 [Sphagnum magellanicum]
MGSGEVVDWVGLCWTTVRTILAAASVDAFNQIRGMSSGEKRRVSIGVDLIHDPFVLFLDEPASGLDSTSALQVMQILSQMVVTCHRTVLLTIHQPSCRLIETINKFLVLARGNVIYHGGISRMADHFSGLGHSMPAHVNVVEYALDVINDNQDQPEGLQKLLESQRFLLVGCIWTVCYQRHHYH